MAVLVLIILALAIIYVFVYMVAKAKYKENAHDNSNIKKATVSNNSSIRNTKVSNDSVHMPDMSHIEPYLTYLKTGAFEKKTLEEDIKLCENIINATDKMLESIHNDNIKAIYIDQATMYKNLISSSIDTYSNKDSAIAVIDACDEVLANPSYENCAYLDDCYMLLNPERCDIKHTDNSKQEIAHIRLYNRLDTVRLMINSTQR